MRALGAILALLFAPLATADDLLVAECPTYGWDASAEGDTYNLFIAEPPGSPSLLLESGIVGNTYTICRWEFNAPFALSVSAVRGGYQSELSEESIPAEWIHSLDWDESGMVGFFDFFAFVRAFGTSEDLVYFDTDNNGMLGFPDYFEFALRFSSTNNGVWETFRPQTP